MAVISLLNLALGLPSQLSFPGRPLPAHTRPPTWTRSIAKVLFSTLILLSLVFLVNYLLDLWAWLYPAVSFYFLWFGWMSLKVPVMEGLVPWVAPSGGYSTFEE